MNTLAAISDQSTIDPGWVKILFAAGLALIALTWFVIDLRRAEVKLNAALPELLNPTVPLTERCAVLYCTKRWTWIYDDFAVCTDHDPLHRTDAS